MVDHRFMSSQQFKSGMGVWTIFKCRVCSPLTPILISMLQMRIFVLWLICSHIYRKTNEADNSKLCSSGHMLRVHNAFICKVNTYHSPSLLEVFSQTICSGHGYFWPGDSYSCKGLPFDDEEQDCGTENEVLLVACFLAEEDSAVERKSSSALEVPHPWS